MVVGVVPCRVVTIHADSLTEFFLFKEKKRRTLDPSASLGLEADRFFLSLLSSASMMTIALAAGEGSGNTIGILFERGVLGAFVKGDPTTEASVA